jgi:hypothetical protein
MKKHFFGLTCAAILSACGGGGSSTDNSNPNNSTDPIDRYIGTWNRKCDTWSTDDISDTNGKGISVIESIKIEKTSSVKASYVYTVKVFANADTQCAAQPIATIVKTGLNNASLSISNATATMTTGFGVNELSYIGTQSLSLETVDKLKQVDSKLSNVTGNVTVGGAIVKTGSPTFQASTNDVLAKFKSSTELFFNTINNGVIPTAMVEDPYSVLTKQ